MSVVYPNTQTVTLVYLLLTVFLTSVAQSLTDSLSQTYANPAGRGYDRQDGGRSGSAELGGKEPWNRDLRSDPDIYGNSIYPSL